MKQKTTTVPTITGPRRVRVIEQRGVWAITPMQVEGGSAKGLYAVTHLPTGAAMPDPCGELDLELARDLLRRLPLRFGEEAESWRKSTAERMPEDATKALSRFDEARAAYQAFCAAHPEFGW